MGSEGKTPPTPGINSIYVGLLAAGIILLGFSFQFMEMWQRTARIGFACIATVLALWLGKGAKLGYVGVGIIWAGVILTFL